MREIVLASTSKYRKTQLETLGLHFRTEKPAFDEESNKNKALTPLQLARFLSSEKAKSLAKPHQITIGGDQLISFKNKVYGKSHYRAQAIEHLMEFQGQTHELITAISLWDGLHEIAFENITLITFKKLNREQIETYVDVDLPFDCAGSYKIEDHGIQLIDKIQTDDFTAIQGIPLMTLAKELAKLKITIPMPKSNGL